jgi:hypothetical protein
MDPITIQLSGSFTDSFPGLGDNVDNSPPLFFDLPPFKRLFIESISAIVSLTSTEQAQSPVLTLLALTYKTGQTVAQYQIPLQYQAKFNAQPANPASAISDWWSMNQLAKGIVPWSGRLMLEGWRGPSDEGSGQAEVTITGYIETTSIIKIPFVKI